MENIKGVSDIKYVGSLKKDVSTSSESCPGTEGMCGNEIYDIISGDFFICYAPYTSENFESMPDNLLQKYLEMFKYPEKFLIKNQTIYIYPEK